MLDTVKDDGPGHALDMDDPLHPQDVGTAQRDQSVPPENEDRGRDRGIQRDRGAGDPAGALSQTWRDDMIWWGPAGIGATCTTPRHIRQHAAPDQADMRVVDLYREDGGTLAENGIFIDLLHDLNMQGLDVLGRMEGKDWVG